MTEITPELIDEFVPTLKGYADCAGTDGFAINAACLMLETIADKLRTGQLVPAQPSGDEVEGRVIADVVKWLRTGGHLQQRCSIQSACVLSNAATALETGEWRNAQSV